MCDVLEVSTRGYYGWSIGKNKTTVLVSQVLKMAVEQRGNVRGVILHSDRGIQYASRD